MVYFVVYCIACWVGSAWWILGSERAKDATKDHEPGDVHAMHLGFALAVSLSPLFVPFTVVLRTAAWIGYFLHKRKYAKFNSQHSDPENIPVNFFDLPEPVRKAFESATSKMFGQKFSLVGDICSQVEPAELVSRAFVSDDGTTFADFWVADGEVLNLITLQSIDVDGVVLETCNQASDHEVKPVREDGIISNSVDTDNLEQTVASHLEILESHDRPLFVFGQDNYAEFGRYIARIGSRWRYGLGQLVNPPPTPTLQQLPNREESEYPELLHDYAASTSSS